jgi:hypothetical protein
MGGTYFADYAETMRVTYFGQACTLIEVGGRKILTDHGLPKGLFGRGFIHMFSLMQVLPDVFKDIDDLFYARTRGPRRSGDTLAFSAAFSAHLQPTLRFRHYLESLGLVTSGR